tara:strand:+ start:57 stop:1418 length:1362 start_codon:yes stop_codon:yes gene_type:complete
MATTFTEKEGYFGSDETSNLFSLPGSDKKYFPLVNKKTGETEIWEDNPDGINKTDKRIGNIGEDGKIKYNGNWIRGASKKDKALINNPKNLHTIKNQSLKTIKNGLREEKGLTGEALDNEANKLNAGANKAFESSAKSFKPANYDLGKESEPTPGTREKDFGVHVFPSSLRQGNDGQDFLKIDMLKFVARDLQGTVGDIDGSGHLGIKERAKPFSKDRQSIGTVILPVPGGLRDNMQVKWQNDTINPFQLAVANIALNTIEQGMAAGLDAAQAAVMTALGTPDTRDAVGKYFAGQAANANNLLTRTTGAIMNPNMELLFNGPDTRNFTFSFILAPRNQHEGKDIIRIIRFFKQGMSPIRSKSRLFLKSPHTFKLAYKRSGSRSGDHPYLNKFKECALRAFNVDYTPNAQYSTYEDGLMTAYQVQMNFQELTPIYNDDYGDGFVNGKIPAEIGF